MRQARLRIILRREQPRISFDTTVEFSDTVCSHHPLVSLVQLLRRSLENKKRYISNNCGTGLA